jgi:acetylornithine deacetylase/succinyl-diaminopimelate desuccinylase-like protein
VARRSVELLGASADMCVHAAGSQTDGRGRRGRTWLDTEGAVMMSIVQKTRLPMEKLPILNLVAAAAVRNALMRLVPGAELSVKWPNDVVTSDRYEKVCGILSEAVSSDGYPAWKMKADSKLTQIVVESYKKLFGKAPVVRGIHAGLECGLFSERYPQLDMVSFGPTLRFVHTPDERLHIPTVQMVWDHLLDVLKNIPQK